MPFPSFPDWLANRAQEPSQADRLATVIAQAGAAGVPLDRLRRLVGLSPEVLGDILKSLVATGQVTVLKTSGQMVYRVAG
jgi:predicted transcriptional regulator